MPASPGPLVADLTRGRITADTGAHLDPDLTRESLPRQPVGGPCSGRWARRLATCATRRRAGGSVSFLWSLPPRRAGRRVLAVGRRRRPLSCAVGLDAGGGDSVAEGGVAGVVCVGRLSSALSAARAGCKCLYLARRHLCVGSDDDDLPGAGIFARYAARRRLTAVDAPRVSDWDLPDWWYPGEGRAPLSYHGDLRRWRRAAGRTALRAVARGQEFVLDTEQYPEALPWARELIRRQAN